VRRASSRLATLAGVEISEIESLNTPVKYSLKSVSSRNISSATVWRDGLRISESSDAQALWVYSDSFFGALDLAAVTQRKSRAGGDVVYLGTGIEPQSLLPLAMETLHTQKIPHVGISDSDQVEHLMRTDVDGKPWQVTINYGHEKASANDGSRLSPYEVRIAPAQKIVAV